MSRKLYVGNLPWTAGEAELRERFSSYGHLRSVRVVLDRETQKSRGFAFLEYETAEEASEALEAENGSDFGGRPLTVSVAVEKGSAPPPRVARPTPPVTTQRTYSPPPPAPEPYKRQRRGNNRRNSYEMDE